MCPACVFGFSCIGIAQFNSFPCFFLEMLLLSQVEGVNPDFGCCNDCLCGFKLGATRLHISKHKQRVNDFLLVSKTMYTFDFRS